ncbi:AraC family transcriptional regulator [Paenibacillus shenyangensis]|uniref:AraC family transcriptional regulator n=1 Tax=Paenibacillus sp. A9 TaxID=1284352 RepID=UPI00037901CF|nr:AraC family transcriptional regulator [Paenibacillus sp. A9]
MPLNHTIYTHSDAHQPLDLHLLFFGKEECLPGHAWGPGIRDAYILHYIHAGTGTLRIGDAEYHLGHGQGFLIPPDTIVQYEADPVEPWVYSWIGFRGLQALSLMERSQLTVSSPVYRMHPESIFGSFYERLLETANQPAGDIQAQGILYQLMYTLIARLPVHTAAAHHSRSKESHIRQAIEYIENSYSQKISVLDISQAAGLDRTYLSSLFKARFGMSLQAFMLEYRMNRAVELLHHTDLSVSEVSRSVGYEDPFLFSKMFKKIKGASPRRLREELLQTGP